MPEKRDAVWKEKLWKQFGSFKNKGDSEDKKLLVGSKTLDNYIPLTR